MPEVDNEVFQEEHYKPAELAKLWTLSPDSIRRLFANEPDVVRLGRQKPGKRRYSSMRIPASVAARVHKKLSLVRDD